MDIAIHKSDGTPPLVTTVADESDLNERLSDQYATFPTATGRTMVNKLHIVSIDLPPAPTSPPA